METLIVIKNYLTMQWKLVKSNIADDRRMYQIRIDGVTKRTNQDIQVDDFLTINVYVDDEGDIIAHPQWDTCAQHLVWYSYVRLGDKDYAHFKHSVFLFDDRMEENDIFHTKGNYETFFDKPSSFDLFVVGFNYIVDDFPDGQITSMANAEANTEACPCQDLLTVDDSLCNFTLRFTHDGFDIRVHDTLLKKIPTMAGMLKFEEGTQNIMTFPDPVAQPTARLWVQALYHGHLPLDWNLLEDLWLLTDKYMTLDRYRKEELLGRLLAMVETSPVDESLSLVWLQWMDALCPPSDSNGANSRYFSSCRDAFLKTFDEETLLLGLQQCPNLLLALYQRGAS